MDRMDHATGRTCVTCVHNSYRNIDACNWVSCSHPVTIEKTPRWQNGDPAWVDLMTSDHRSDQIMDMPDCPAYEAPQ